MTPLRLILAGLFCLVLLAVYTWEFPRLVVSGHQPPSLVGVILGILGPALLVAALVRAITTPRRSSHRRPENP